MLRPLALTALALAVVFPAAPALAEDDLVRQLVNACIGCRFPKDLHGRDLHGLRFIGADLRGVDLSHADLKGAVFTGSDLEDARFDDADLRNARFTGTHFQNTSFARAKTDGVRMQGVELDARAIVGADYRPFLRGCTGCDLSSMRLSSRERRMRTMVGAVPPIPPDTERYFREMERHLREMERHLREHPPAIPPDVQRRLHELDGRSPTHFYSMPPMPATPPLPPMRPAPSAPAAPPAPPIPAPSP